MTDILIINHKTKNCGVYQFGGRVADLALKSNLDILYAEIENADTYKKLIRRFKPRSVLHNWYPVTMNWLSEDILNHNIKNFFIFHDGFTYSKYDKYVFFGNYEKPDSIRIPEDKKFLLPRPLLGYYGKITKHKVPRIGSFGFGFWHKGFTEVVSKVNEEFDKAIINLHIPNAHFGDSDGETARAVIEECHNRNVKTNIKLNITSDMKTDEELLMFLANNDLNCFFYNTANEGLSSVIDYALSVKRPIAITDNMMFRHIVSDDIIISKNSLVEILNKGTKPLEKFYQDWSIELFIKEFETAFKKELDNE